MTKRPRAESPLIGITPDSGTTPAGPSGAKGEPVIVLQTRYARALVEAGGIPVVLPIMPSRKAIRQALERLDGVLISGGNFDIDPGLYGEESIEGLGKLKEDRTAFELELISLSLERELPLLGVCGGAQAINIALGGSLYQDIATQLPQARSHEQSALKETGGHPIKIHAATKLKRIVREDVLEVNTTHHQAVKKLGTGLIVNATADDGVIEGIESQVHPFVLGVQWHPEFMIHRDSRQRKIFASLIAACKGVPPKPARS